jgi:hypothetical protein
MKKHFETISDPRQPWKVERNLLKIVVMTICAVISGCEYWEDIWDFCRVKEQWFKEKLGLKLANGIASHDTFQRVFSFSLELFFQNLWGIALDLYILKIMVDLIACTPAIAINTAVEATTIKVHAVFGGKDSLSLCNYEPGMPTGLRGTVMGHDDQPSLLMAWDNHRSLSLFPGEDSFRVLTHEEIAEEQAEAQGNIYAGKAIRSYYDYTSRAHGNASMSAAIGSLRLLGHLARIMKNRLDEEERQDGSVGLIDRKLRRKIKEKKQAMGLRGMGD